VSAIEAVFFDLGDTLWHFPAMPPVEVIRGETMKRVSALVRSWGYTVTGERAYLARDIRFAIEEATSRAFHTDCIDPNYPEICRRVAAHHGLDLTSEQGAQLWEAWNLGGAFLGRRLFPDVLDTLRWLKEAGYRLGAITNRGYSGPRFHQELRDLGLADFFEVMAISCDIGYMKPHPRIFQYALDAMGVEPGAAAMVGDNLRADVEGAKTMGMVTVWRRPLAAEPVEATEDAPETSGPVRPDYTINTIADLKRLPLFSQR